MRTMLLTALIAIMLVATPAFCTGSTEARTAIDKAKTDIEVLKQSGISTFAVNDLLKEAELQFSLGNYGRAGEVATEISDLKESALNANDLMNRAEPLMVDLEKQGVDTKDIRDAFSKASEAFLRDDFKTAETYAQDAMDRVGDAQSTAGIQKTLFEAEGKAAAAFVGQYWIEILAAFVLTIIFARHAWKKHEKFARRTKATRLEARRTMVLRLMKEAQQKHFIDGTICKKEYLISMRNYREQLTDIKRQLKLLRG